MRQAVFLKDGVGGYVAEVPSLPGCRAKGKNLNEITVNTRQAIYAYIANLEAQGQPIPEATIIDVPKAEGVIPYNLLLREDVIQVIREVLPNEDLQTILSVLSEYGQQPYEIDVERLQIACVQLSEGDVDKLLQLVSEAKRDYRDVLLYYVTKFGRYP